MKKLSVIIALFIVIVSCKGNENKPADSLATANSISTTNQNNLKRYQVKSGIIKYETKISGKVIASTITGSGTEERYFKNWGALELYEQKSTTKTVTKVMGQVMSETTDDHQMTKLENGFSYLVDFKTKSILKQKDMAMEAIKKLHPDADAEKASKAMFKELGGKLIGKENFKNYTCEIWDLMGVKQWIYKGVMLKSEAKLMGITTITEAIEVNFDSSVSDSKFTLPNFPIKEMESLMGGENMDFDLDDINADLDKISKLSFEEWKKMALADKEDEEMQNMSDEELREMFNMIQKMAKMRKGK